MDDAYDQLLTRDEIQTHVDKVNMLINIEAVEHCVSNRDKHSLFLRLQAMKLQVKSAKKEAYFAELSRIMAEVEFLRWAREKKTPAKLGKTQKRITVGTF